MYEDSDYNLFNTKSSRVMFISIYLYLYFTI